MVKYVVIDEQDSGARFCLGIYDNYLTALGKVMDYIYDFKESFKDDNTDYFEFSDPYQLEGECGEGIEIKYKAGCWEHECKEYLFILYHHPDEEENK